VGARLLASTPARDAVFQLGGEPWYGYWYGVIPQVVEGESYLGLNQWQGFRGALFHEICTVVNPRSVVACRDLWHTHIPLGTGTAKVGQNVEFPPIHSWFMQDLHGSRLT